MKRLTCPKCLCHLKRVEDSIYDKADGSSVFGLHYECLICGRQFHGKGRDRSQALRRLYTAIKKGRDEGQEHGPDQDATRRLH